MPDQPHSPFIDEDPRETLSRLLVIEEHRLQDRRQELATVRNALLRLHDRDLTTAVPGLSPITVEVAPTLLRSLLDDQPGPVRNAIMRMDVGSGTAEDWMAYNLQAVRAGKEQRTVYDDSVLEHEALVGEIAQWAAAGERQRVLSGVPSEFMVYGESVAVSVREWGDPASQYVVVRDPMLVRLFIAFFDAMWQAASPMPSSRAAAGATEDDHLLELLARGFKDEAIARYLGWSLRTVRRRVARLMEELGARTRFQLGAQAARAARLPAERRPEAPAYPSGTSVTSGRPDLAAPAGAPEGTG